MPDKFAKTNGTLNRFLKFILGRYLNALFALKYNVEGISGLTPPYAVIANHVNFWDPFIVSLPISEPVHFVASDSYFRNPVLRRALRLVGAIPKTKFVADPQTIRDVMAVSRHNGIVGIFPEGRRNWDGKTLPLRFATAKLIKSLSLPVVSVLMEGASLAYPRWAIKPRRGEINVSVKLLLDRHDISDMSPEVIFDKITSALAHDEYTVQEKAMRPYRGRKLAEKLELFLFTCPECRSIGTLTSSGSSFTCSACDYSVVYDDYGYFKLKNGKKLHFDNPRDWNDWQLEQLDMRFREKNSVSQASPLFEEKSVFAFTGARLKPLVKFQQGTLSMYSDRLVFQGLVGEPLVFEIPKIHGETIQSNNKFEFYYNKVLYRFIRLDKCLSAYKWVRALQAARNARHQSELEAR